MSESHGQFSLTAPIDPPINLPDLLEASIASLVDFVYTFNLDGRVLYANPSLLTLWGKTLDEAVGKNFHELGYAPELAARLQAQIQEVVQTGRPINNET